MKMKRVLSLLLALVMCLAMAAPAFAAEPEDPNEGIELHMQLFENPYVNDSTGTYHTDNFTSTPGNGTYIKVWYRNYSDERATVVLYNKNGTDLKAMNIAPGGEGEIWYTGSNTTAVSYYVRILSEYSGQVTGYLAVAQKRSK